jgi:hypothetical protein
MYLLLRMPLPVTTIPLCSAVLTTRSGVRTPPDLLSWARRLKQNEFNGSVVYLSVIQRIGQHAVQLVNSLIVNIIPSR